MKPEPKKYSIADLDDDGLQDLLLKTSSNKIKKDSFAKPAHNELAPEVVAEETTEVEKPKIDTASETTKEESVDVSESVTGIGKVVQPASEKPKSVTIEPVKEKPTEISEAEKPVSRKQAKDEYVEKFLSKPIPCSKSAVLKVPKTTFDRF